MPTGLCEHLCSFWHSGSLMPLGDFGRSPWLFGKTNHEKHFNSSRRDVGS